jgi:2-C-methyl-D-erythritol 4-phosphate cytidylyltransferase
MFKKTVIITAGGIGKRMDSSLPKQFIELNDKAILLHSLETFYQYDKNIQIIITLPNDWKTYWEKYLEKKSVSIPHLIIDGGLERFHSIKNALIHSTGDVIAVHDGVRPLVTQNLISKCFEEAWRHKSAVPVVKIKESLRKIESKNSIAVNRNDYVLVQTPQCFNVNLIVKAYQNDFQSHFTDDASLVEEFVTSVNLIEGEENNLKITTPLDLKIAKLIRNE